ncbi:MAG: HEPN domain-containing protein [Candidatus Omnitrophota bacterium]
MALKPIEEWIRQANYDLQTAKSLFTTKRYIYTIFMCHLSIEKALKAIYTKKLKEVPLKTRNLLYLVEKIKLKLPEALYDFIFNLNRVSIPTRYPDDLQRMLKDYNEIKVKGILIKSEEVLKWIKTRL